MPVTHQLDITALSRVYPAAGEAAVVHRAVDGKLTLTAALWLIS